MLALQSVVQGLQDLAGVILRENLGRKNLRGDEVGGDEAKETCPEQHCVGWGSRREGPPGGTEEMGRRGKGF